jgi:hypothetical protein
VGRSGTLGCSDGALGDPGRWGPNLRPTRRAPTRDDIDNAACNDYTGETELAPWNEFDWCNRLESEFGAFRKGRVEYAESDESGRHLDAVRITIELLRVGWGDFDGDGTRDLALISRRRIVDASAGLSVQSQLEWSVYKWREGGSQR